MRISARPYIGPVPAYWSDAKLKYVLKSPVTDGPHETPVFIDEGRPFLSVDGIQDGKLIFEGCRFIAQEAFDEYREKATPEIGDLLMGKAASTGKIARVTEPIEFAIWSPLALIKLDQSKVDSRFIEYVLKTPALQQQIDDLCNANTQKNIGMGDIPKLAFALPPNLEQVSIANFLDEKTARIDALIAEKERLRVTLEEWRAAELTRICFGEDRKPLATGNDWIPTLPQGWKLVRLKHLVTGIEQGWSPECEARHADEDEWGVLKAGAANAGTYRQDEHKALPSAMQPMPELEVKPGDVLITRASGTADYVGSFAYVYSTRPKLMLSDKNFRLRFEPRPKLLPELLAWMCNTRALREQVLQYVSGADGLAKNIGSGSLKEFWLALPPLAEQPRLIQELHARREQLEGLEKHLIVHVTRLREYRSSLISAAVTGQLEVGALDGAA